MGIRSHKRRCEYRRILVHGNAARAQAEIAQELVIEDRLIRAALRWLSAPSTASSTGWHPLHDTKYTNSESLLTLARLAIEW